MVISVKYWELQPNVRFTKISGSTLFLFSSNTMDSIATGEENKIIDESMNFELLICILIVMINTHAKCNCRYIRCVQTEVLPV